MIIDLHLSSEEVARLEAGGFITLVLPDRVRVVVKKDNEVKEGEK